MLSFALISRIAEEVVWLEVEKAMDEQAALEEQRLYADPDFEQQLDEVDDDEDTLVNPGLLNDGSQ